jgi:hypothetical protein
VGCVAFEEIEQRESFDVVFFASVGWGSVSSGLFVYLAMCHDSTLQIGLEKYALYVEIKQIVHTSLLWPAHVGHSWQ